MRSVVSATKFLISFDPITLSVRYIITNETVKANGNEYQFKIIQIWLLDQTGRKEVFNFL